MGWLFGRKKKVPQVPLPPGYLLDENTLRFPSKASKEKVIEPEALKEAAGITEPLELAPEPGNGFSLEEEFPTTPSSLEAAPSSNPLSFAPDREEPLFIQVEVYREVLGEADGLKRELQHLQEIHKSLENSEYNEENNFTRLRRAVKGMHDRLLEVDKILFKS